MKSPPKTQYIKTPGDPLTKPKIETDEERSLTQLQSWLVPRQERPPKIRLLPARSTSLCPWQALQCTLRRPICGPRGRTQRASGDNAQRALVVS